MWVVCYPNSAAGKRSLQIHTETRVVGENWGMLGDCDVCMTQFYRSRNSQRKSKNRFPLLWFINGITAQQLEPFAIV